MLSSGRWQSAKQTGIFAVTIALLLLRERLICENKERAIGLDDQIATLGKALTRDDRGHKFLAVARDFPCFVVHWNGSDRA